MLTGQTFGDAGDRVGHRDGDRDGISGGNKADCVVGGAGADIGGAGTDTFTSCTTSYQ